MDDITSQNDEKGRELARETGKREEQDAQRQRDLATEKGRKQGLDEERNREKQDKQKAGWGTGMKIGIIIIVLAIVVIAAALLTVSVNVTNISPGDVLPYTTNYGTSFPEGQTIQIGNTQISAISYGNMVTTDVNDNQQQLVVGQTQVISEQHARITTLGVITLMNTNFQIDLTYKGALDNRAYFDIAIHTGSQVPSQLIRLLLPSQIDATPI
jgi:predicted metalloprotease